MLAIEWILRSPLDYLTLTTRCKLNSVTQFNHNANNCRPSNVNNCRLECKSVMEVKVNYETHGVLISSNIEMMN